ncbi:MAG: ATP-binding cassette domain-containing protein [Fibromonadales bacterium]|nr:ATP-binding cassette domain-containing protein [Fibromonadales bacterium]
MKISRFGNDLQRKIKKALSRFWQERFISLEDEDSPSVRDFLLKNPFFLNSEHFVESEPFPKTNGALLGEALSLAGIPEHILEQKLPSLSNGELRRLLLARNYMEEPDLWILDDPFGGLDPEYRGFLAERIKLFQQKGIEMQINLKREDERFLLEASHTPIVANDENIYEIKKIKEPILVGEILFSLKNVCVSFGKKKIIENLNWEVRKGEHWAITGANGSGKSTLLGILSGDHPQIYKNNLELLGQNVKESFSISEHKNKLGFFSPEMALQVHRRATVLDALLENFPQPVLAQEKKMALSLLTSLGLENELNKHLRDLSEEELRLALIARAISMSPEVLLLDEPTQGMSEQSKKRLFLLLDKISEKTTLIFTSHYPGECPSCVTHGLHLFCQNSIWILPIESVTE